MCERLESYGHECNNETPDTSINKKLNKATIMVGSESILYFMKVQVTIVWCLGWWYWDVLRDSKKWDLHWYVPLL